MHERPQLAYRAVKLKQMPHIQSLGARWQVGSMPHFCCIGGASRRREYLICDPALSTSEAQFECILGPMLCNRRRRKRLLC